jgi:hypothetical protein
MSRGWEVFNELHGPSLANFQISKPYFFSEKGLGLLPSWFTDLKQDSLSFDQRIVNFKNFGLDCDNFTVEFETTTLEPKHFCSLITFRLFGSLKHLECRMGPSHCSHYNFVNISERFLNGANVDLNKMSHPYGQKNLTRIEVKKRHARIFVNEKEVFSDAYEKPTGDLKGVSIGVNGFAYLHSFKAWDAKGKLVVDDQFGKK